MDQFVTTIESGRPADLLTKVIPATAHTWVALRPE